MNDQDFDFSPPPPRRERKEFEPPPWEKHLFEERAQEKEPDTDAERSEPADGSVSPAEAERVTGKPDVSYSPPPADGEGEPEKPQLDEALVAAMMFELRAEEVPATRMFVKATLAAGAVLLLVGIVMVVWAFTMIAVALRRPDQGRPGLFVGVTVLVFGAGFAATGAWFVFKTLRQQGVL